MSFFFKIGFIFLCNHIINIFSVDNLFCDIINISSVDNLFCDTNIIFEYLEIYDFEVTDLEIYDFEVTDLEITDLE
jgi:hypothetical protein